MSYFLMNLFKTYGLSRKGLHLGGGQNAPKIAYILFWMDYPFPKLSCHTYSYTNTGPNTHFITFKGCKAAGLKANFAKTSNFDPLS